MIGIISYLVFFLTIGFVLAIAVLGLNLQWGYTGLFNGGVSAFFGAGAYGVILFGGSNKAVQLIGLGLPYPFAVAGAVLLAGLLALIVGLITTRLRHDYLAIATFGVAIAVENFARNAGPITGGAKGLRGFERPFESAINDPFWFNLAYLIFVLVVLIIVYNILESIARSPYGRLLRAIREDEVAAQSLGKSPARVRHQAFIFGSMIMGLSGALYATFYAFISPQDILPILTFQIWSMLIVGGSGNNRGAVLGTLVVWAGWVGSGWALTKFAPVEAQLYVGTIQFIMIGLIIVLTLLIKPKGLLPEQLIISHSLDWTESDRDCANCKKQVGL
mgnify:FL=1